MHTQTHAFNTKQTHARTHTHTHTHTAHKYLHKHTHLGMHIYTLIILHTYTRAYFLVFKNTQTYTSAH